MFAGDMASVVTELEGYIRETQASGGQQVTVLKQVSSVVISSVPDSLASHSMSSNANLLGAYCGVYHT